MLSRFCSIRIIIALLALVCLASSADAATGRAVSLNVLKSVLEAGGAKDASRLCGITRVVGYMPDVRAKDVILIGEVDPSLPQLSLDDFVVALRNASYLYTTVSGRTRYYAAPGCSIDPNPKVLRELQQIHSHAVDFSDSESLKNYMDEWNRIGSQPQKVRVMGVPFDTRFARVMVDADYYMKRLVNGSVSLGINGFESLSGMHANKVEQDIRAGKSSPPTQSLNRFWFSPGESTYTEDDGVIMLKSCQVQLLTEEEFLTECGEVAGFGRPSSLAKQFAHSFSTHYAQIAAARPIYKELESLFRFVAVAKLMKADNARCTGLSYLLKSYIVKNTPVGRTLPGLTNFKQLKLDDDNSDGPIRALFPICGGVCMDVKPKRVGGAFKPVKSRVVTKPAVSAVRTAPHTQAATAVHTPGIKKAVLSARKSPKSLSWDFQLPASK